MGWDLEKSFGWKLQSVNILKARDDDYYKIKYSKLLEKWMNFELFFLNWGV